MDLKIVILIKISKHIGKNSRKVRKYEIYIFMKLINNYNGILKHRVPSGNALYIVLSMKQLEKRKYICKQIICHVNTIY